MTFTESLLNLKDKVIAVDIDGTLCTEEKTFERPLARPLPGAVEALKMLKKNNNVIIMWTGRGWEQYRVTKKWLDDNDIPFDQIIMGKPIVNYFIDDRARHFKSWSEVVI